MRVAAAHKKYVAQDERSRVVRGHARVPLPRSELRQQRPRQRQRKRSPKSEFALPQN